MKRSYVYHNKIALKLISSKFISPQVASKVPIDRLVIKAKIRGREPEASTVAVSVMFSRKPAFHKHFLRSEGSSVLQNLYLTARKQSASAHIDVFSTFILPFQLENQPLRAKTALHKEFSWSTPHCLPPTILNPIFFPYPVPNTDTDLVLSIVPDKTLRVSIFYLNLLRVPISLV